MDKQKSVNSALRRARLSHGLTQKKLAEAIGVEEQTVRRWEHGLRVVSTEYILPLSRVLGETPEALGILPPVEYDQKVAPAEVSAVRIEHDSIHSLSRVDGDRERMLRRVYLRWIEGIFSHSLYNEVLVVLGLQIQSGAVSNPWRLVMQETSDLPTQMLPVGTRIVDVYDRSDGLLLILGDPGAGKTTLLLELAEALIHRARQDDRFPIPVVFNLSSWAERRISFDGWVVNELHEKYGIPVPLARVWMENEQILPLLDGFDEIAEVYRSECIEVINMYRREHGLVQMVICSRLNDYFAQMTLVSLQMAVVVQPLTEEQIFEYVRMGGEKLVALSEALEQDALLLELASTPLMLSILALIYCDQNIEGLFEGSLSERRRLIFEKYVEVALHRGPKSKYAFGDTRRWLAWLASRMHDCSQAEFYVERLQPDWLVSSGSRERYYTSVIRIANAWGTFLTIGLFGLLRGDNIGIGGGLFGWLGAPPGDVVLGWMGNGAGEGFKSEDTIALIYGLVAVLVSILVRVASNEMEWKVEWTSKRLKHVGYSLLVGLFQGVIAGFLLAVLGFGWFFLAKRGIVNSLYNGVGAGLMGGTTIGLVNGFIGMINWKGSASEIKNRRRKRFLVRFVDALIIGISAGIAYACVNGLIAGPNEIVVQSIITASCSFLLFLSDDRLVNNLGNGLGYEIRPAEEVSWSWLKVRLHISRDFRVVLLLCVSVTFITSLVVALSNMLLDETFVHSIIYGVVLGPIVGLIVGSATLFSGILNRGWSSAMLEERHFVLPNEGIRRSFHNSIVVALVIGLLTAMLSAGVIGFAFGVLGGLPGWFALGGGFGLCFGIYFFYIFGMAYGGVAVLAHVVLRFMLWRSGSIPVEYIKFLDYASERILLRKIGGGYMFIHRQLLEYFAETSVSSKKDTE